MLKLHKKCTKCFLVKPRDAFHFTNKEKSWIKPECKECRSKENYNPLSNRHKSSQKRKTERLEYKRLFYKKHMADNPEKYRLYTIQRRARLKNAEGTFTEAQWKEKFIYYGKCCFYCGNSLTDKTATKDHKIALIHHGTNWIANIVPACHPCNSGKCDTDYLKYKQKYANNSLRTSRESNQSS